MTCLVCGVLYSWSIITKSLNEAVADPLPKHLLFGWWSSHVQLLPSPWMRRQLILSQNICCLVGGVLMCNCYQVLEWGGSWSSPKTSAVWLVELSCAIVTKSLNEAVADPLPKHLLFGWWISHVQLLPSPWMRRQLILSQNICCLVGGVITCNCYQVLEWGSSWSSPKTSAVWLVEFSCAIVTKSLNEAAADPLPKHLLFGWWSSHVQLLPSPWMRRQLILSQNICCLVGGVIMCNCYQVLEWGSSWSSPKTSAVWLVDFSCAIVTKSLNEAAADPLPKHLLFGWWSYHVQLLPSPWMRQ